MNTSPQKFNLLLRSFFTCKRDLILIHYVTQFSCMWSGYSHIQLSQEVDFPSLMAQEPRRPHILGAVFSGPFRTLPLVRENVWPPDNAQRIARCHANVPVLALKQPQDLMVRVSDRRWSLVGIASEQCAWQQTRATYNTA